MNANKQIALMLSIVAIVFMSVFYFLLEEFTLQEAKNRVTNVLTQYHAIQHFNKTVQKPQIYNLQKEGVISKDYFDPSLMSSSFIASHVATEHQKFLKEQGLNTHIELKFASKNPTNPINKATPYEAKVLENMESNNLEYFLETIEKDGHKQLFYAYATNKNTPSCLRCHGDPKDAPADMIEKYGSKNGFFEKEGDVRAIVALYTPLDTEDTEKDVFFYFVLALLFATFLIIFILMRFYNKKIGEKDTMLMEQSHFATMGELSSILVTRWKQPLTLISSRVNNLILDVEMDMVDPEIHLKNLEAVAAETQTLSSSIDYFKHFFNPDRSKSCVDINSIIEESLIILYKLIKDKNVSVEKKYASLNKHEVCVSVLMLVITQVLKSILENVTTTEPALVISTVQKGSTLHLTVTVNETNILPQDFHQNINTDSIKDENMNLYMVNMLIQKQLSGNLDVTLDASSTLISISMPVFECKEK